MRWVRSTSQGAVAALLGWEENCTPGITSVMCQTLWYICLWAQDLWNGDEQPNLFSSTVYGNGKSLTFLLSFHFISIIISLPQVIISGLDHESPVYTIQPVVNGFDNRVNVCIHDTTGCQTRCQTGCTTRFDNRVNEQLFVQHGCQTRLTIGQIYLTTGCIVYTNIQPVVKPCLSNRLYNPVWQPVERTAVRSTRLSNPFDNRFDKRLDVCLHDTTGCIV